MSVIQQVPSLTEQVRNALLADIASGRLAAGARLVQEQIAASLGVSRQPVQQALALLREQGIVQDAPGRGLEVAALDPLKLQQMFEMRSVIEGLACRLAAQRLQTGAKAQKLGLGLLDEGRAASRHGTLAEMIEADMRFHMFLYELSGNPLIAPSQTPNWAYIRRVMGAVLTLDDEAPAGVWDEHEAIMMAVLDGDALRAEQHMKKHIMESAGFVIDRLRKGRPATAGLPHVA